MKLNEDEKVMQEDIKMAKDSIEMYKDIIGNMIRQMPEWYQHEYQINEYIKKCGFTQGVKDIVKGYRDKIIEEYYIAHSTEIVIRDTFISCKYLYENGYLGG